MEAIPMTPAESPLTPQDLSAETRAKMRSTGSPWMREAVTVIDALRARLATVTQERDEAREFGEQAANAHNALLLDRKTTCVYCGHEYEGDTPDHAQLTAHVSTCQKHPLAASREQVRVLRTALKQAENTTRSPKLVNSSGRLWPAPGCRLANSTAAPAPLPSASSGASSFSRLKALICWTVTSRPVVGSSRI